MKKYLIIYFRILLDEIKIKYINLIIIKFKNPKLRLGRFARIQLGNQARIILDSNQFFDNVKISVADYGIFALAKGSWIGENVTINAENILIKQYTGIHSCGTLIGDISIGEYVMIAKNVFMSSGKHHYDYIAELPIKIQDNIYEDTYGAYSKKIVIEDDVWIGVNCVIMSGICIGKGSVVGSNSVVTSDIPPYSVYAGSPAKKIKSRLEFIPPSKVNALYEPDLPYFYSGFIVEGKPLQRLEHSELIKARGNFTVALGRVNENFITLTIKTIHNNPIKLFYNNQPQEVSYNLSNITFNIDLTSDTNRFSFEITKDSNQYHEVCFEISEVFLH